MGRRWTAEEDAALRIGFETAMSCADIARSIGNGRTAHAAQCRAQALGLKWGGGDQHRKALFHEKGAEGRARRSEKNRDLVRQLAADGLSKKQIRERTGFSGELVRRALLGIKVKHHPRAGVKLKPRTPEQRAQGIANLKGGSVANREKAEREWAAIRDEAIARVTEGQTVKSVAAHFGRTREYMARWLLASGWRRPRKEKPTPRQTLGRMGNRGSATPQADTRGNIPDVVRELQQFGPCFRHDVRLDGFWKRPPSAYIFAGRTYLMDELPGLLARVRTETMRRAA